MRTRLSRALLHPAIWGSFLLKAILLVWVSRHGFWHSGDTGYYLDSAKEVCNGAWGGDPFRTPLYSWIICSCSIGGIPLVLALQSFLLWAAGVWIFTRPQPHAKTAAFLWLFDPVLLAYGQLAMSDAIFTILVLFLALQYSRFVLRGMGAGFRDAALLGVLCALVILDRPIGEPMIAACIAFTFVLLVIRKVSSRAFVTVLLVTLVLLMPRLIWMKKQTGKWALANQGGEYIWTTAAAVENAGSGLGFYASERKWQLDHPHATSAVAIRSLVHHLPTFASLASKGALRVVFGHVNVEWVYLATGKNILGPGWFRGKSLAPGDRISGPFGIALWCAGILWTLIFCLFGYALVWKRIRKDPPDTAFTLWCLTVAAFLIASPQIYGDARFRAPVWALLTALLICRSRASCQPDKMMAKGKLEPC